MKAKGVILLSLVVWLASYSCQKEVKPVVTFTVVDTAGTALDSARLFTHPCFDGVSCDTSRINPAFIKDGVTNGAGQITFEYPYSAIIEVFANYAANAADSTSGFYEGQTVARFDSKRTRTNESNEYSVRVVLKQIY
jgi:hypothetical protein